MHRLSCLLAAAAIGTGYPGIAQADTTISDCDVASLATWSYSSDPNAQGSLTSAAGHSGGCGYLAYDISNGGGWVYASLTLATPLTPSLIALWVRSPLDTKATLHLADTGGQTFEYELKRTLEGSFDVNAWYRVLVNVATPLRYFGGENDGVSRPPFSKLGVLAFPGTGTKGWVEFDDIVALDGVSIQLDPEAMSLLPAPEGSGDFLNRLGINVHAPNDDARERSLDIAAAAGFSIARADSNWATIETSPGTYDFSGLDEYSQSLGRRRMRMHVILAYANSLYPKPDASGFAATTIPAFAAMSRAMAAHFAGQNVTYEVWNEPDESGFWSTTPDPTAYAALCQAAIAAIHDGDPSAMVSTAGVAGFDYDFWKPALAAGAAQGANAIGVHPYRLGGGESIGSDLLKLRAFLSDAISMSLPVWATEWGYSSTWFGDGHGTTERVTQARLVARELLSSVAVGLPKIFVYDLRDDGTDPANAEQNFGLVQNDFSDKPAIVAVRTLSKVAGGRAYAGMLDTNVGGIHAMRWNGAADTVVALWSENGDIAIHARVPSTVAVMDMLGGTPATTSTSNGKVLRLVGDDGPIYVKFPSVVDADATQHFDDPSAGGSAGVRGNSGGAPGGCGCTLVGGPKAADFAGARWVWGVATFAGLGNLRRRGRRARAESDYPAADTPKRPPALT